VYSVPDIPLETSPVIPSITAPSVGTGLKANTPPVSPVIVATAPSHVGVIIKDASSPGNNVALIILDAQPPAIIY
jgi:hypothetical protein